MPFPICAKMGYKSGTREIVLPKC